MFFSSVFFFLFFFGCSFFLDLFYRLPVGGVRSYLPVQWSLCATNYYFYILNTILNNRTSWTHILLTRLIYVLFKNKNKYNIYIFLGIKNIMIVVKTWRRTISYPNLCSRHHITAISKVCNIVIYNFVKSWSLVIRSSINIL